jgi:NAD(P)-dependent dehydrogenase (short-subunit alcohol dehydrogenase family)
MTQGIKDKVIVVTGGRSKRGKAAARRRHGRQNLQINPNNGDEMRQT